MAHQDQGRSVSGCSHADELHQALQWLLTGASFTSIAFRCDCTWTASTLTFAALLWAWSDEKTLVERFIVARKIIISRSKDQQEPAGSYQAFIKLLVKWTELLRVALAAAFRQRMLQSLASVWRLERWLVFAADGSKIDVPRTGGNEQRYSPRSKLSREAQKRRRQAKRRRSLRERQGRKANVPRIFLTTVWHVGSGLAWDWRTGPSDSSERGHLREMLPSLPQGSLLTADAGFVGYDFWKTIQDAGHQLLVRVGSNVKLLRKLGYVRERNDIVYLWPDQIAKKALRPLVLRLVIVTGRRRPVYLVTSVLNSRELSDQQVARIYGCRWGIEVYHRHCKQTFERRKLRSHNPDNAMVELHWALLGMWAMGLHSHARLVRQNVPIRRISFAGIWRAYRCAMREYKSHIEPGDRLRDLIDQAIIDPYQRKSKTSRDYPRKKQERAAGPPIIRIATRAQIQQAQRVKNEHKTRLTA